MDAFPPQNIGQIPLFSNSRLPPKDESPPSCTDTTPICTRPPLLWPRPLPSEHPVRPLLKVDDELVSVKQKKVCCLRLPLPRDVIRGACRNQRVRRGPRAAQCCARGTVEQHKLSMVSPPGTSGTLEIFFDGRPCGAVCSNTRKIPSSQRDCVNSICLTLIGLDTTTHCHLRSHLMTSNQAEYPKRVDGRSIHGKTCILGSTGQNLKEIAAAR